MKKIQKGLALHKEAIRHLNIFELKAGGITGGEQKQTETQCLPTAGLGCRTSEGIVCGTL
jgi:hypothetical protein